MALPLLAYGPTLYLDARYPLGEGVTPPANGAVVGTWTDLSGNGFDVTQATSSRQPLYVSSSGTAGGKPALDFDGTDDFLEVLGLPQDANITMYVVSLLINTGTFRVVAGRVNTTGSHVDPYFRYLFGYNVSPAVDLRRATTASGVAVSVLQAATRAVHTALFTSFTLRRDGVQYIAPTANVTVTYPNGDTPFRVGANAAGTEALAGQVLAVLVFPTTHDLATQQAIEAELTAFTTPARTTVALTSLTPSAWAVTAATSPTNITPAYPTGLAEDDAVYAVIHSKPSTIDITTPTGWRKVGSVAATSTGVQGAGTGPTRITVFQRTVPTAGLTGTQAFTWTGTMSVAQASMNAFHPPAGSTGVAYEDVVGGWSIPTGGSTASTTIGGSVAGVPVAALDQLLVTFGITDDDTTAVTFSGISATGATFGTRTAAPALSVTANGNDMASATYQVPVSTGSSTANVVVTATQDIANTMVGTVLRVRATTPVVTVVPPRRRVGKFVF